MFTQSMAAQPETRDGARAWYREHRAGVIARLSDVSDPRGRRATALVVLAFDDDPAALARAEAVRRVDALPLAPARHTHPGR